MKVARDVRAIIAGLIAFVLGSCGRSGGDASHVPPSPTPNSSPENFVYDCPTAAGLAMFHLTGDRAAHVKSHNDGYEAQLAPGVLYVEIDSCWTGSRIMVRGLEYQWTNTRYPLELSFAAGNIRTLRVVRSSSGTVIDARDNRGVLKTFRSMGTPESVVGYFDPSPSQLFYNLSDEDRARLHASIVVIEDSKMGPMLKLETVP